MDVPAVKKKEVMHRLARLEGQIRAVRKMIEGGEQCENIVVQLSAVHAALEGATKLVVAGYLGECLENAAARGEEREAAVDRFISLLLKTRM